MSVFLLRAAVAVLCFVPAITGSPQQRWFTWNATEMREWLGQPTGPAAAGLNGRPPCVKAVRSDMSDKLRLSNALSAACRKICAPHFKEGHWQVNPSGDEDVPEACITQGQLSFTGLNPSKGSKQVDKQDASNDLNTPATQTIQLGGSDGTSVDVSLTSTASFSQSISLQVEVPEVLKVTTTDTFSFSSSKTSSHTDSTTRSFSNAVSATIPPHQSVCAYLDVDTETYDSQFNIDVCVTGGFRCSYGKRCNGHYYWYGDLRMAGDTCFTLTGSAHANQAVESHARTEPGKCSSAGAKVLV